MFLRIELPHTASYLEIIGVIFESRSFWVLLCWYVPELLLLLAPQPSAVCFTFSAEEDGKEARDKILKGEI